MRPTMKAWQALPDAGVGDRLAVAGTWQAATGRPPTRRELLTEFYRLDPKEPPPHLRLLISAQRKDPVGLAVPPLLGGAKISILSWGRR